MVEKDLATKERAIWNPRALQLLREKAAVQCALNIVPRTVNGTNIHFPGTEIALGLRVVVRSKRIAGRSLLEVIYEREMQEFALDMAMVALEALNRADVTSGPFALFSRVYRPVRALRVIVAERLRAPVLSSEQRRELNYLVSSYVRCREGERRTLVHGDLHAGNLVVNREGKSLGFVDMEMMHIGKPVTNFAQLWISFHFADLSLGRRLYQRYMSRFSGTLDAHFDPDARAEIALRCYSLVREAVRVGHAELEHKARTLLGNVLKGEGFERLM